MCTQRCRTCPHTPPLRRCCYSTQPHTTCPQNTATRPQDIPPRPSRPFPTSHPPFPFTANCQGLKFASASAARARASALNSGSVSLVLHDATYCMGCRTEEADVSSAPGRRGGRPCGDDCTHGADVWHWLRHLVWPALATPRPHTCVVPGVPPARQYGAHRLIWWMCANYPRPLPGSPRPHVTSSPTHPPVTRTRARPDGP